MSSMSNTIMQLVIYLINALSVHVALSPPNPPVKRQDCYTGTRETDTLFEHVVRYVTFLTKTCVWFYTSFNVGGILSFHELAFSTCSATTLKNSRHVLSSVHPILIFGTTLTFLSAVLRLWCYRTLGHLFTFEITLRPKHELITHGPYHYVRHPSYTGIYLTLIGSSCVLIAPGTWTADHGIRTPVGALLLVFWFLKCIFACRGVGVRLRAEDELLQAKFGAEWEAYAIRVPQKYIPWLY